MIDTEINSSYKAFSLSFAKALVAEAFSDAYFMLDAEFRLVMDESSLKQRYLQMIAYGDGKPIDVEVTETLEEWPGKRVTDVGWAYMAISGVNYSEAVAVVVTLENERLAIRSVEWGRP